MRLDRPVPASLHSPDEARRNLALLNAHARLALACPPFDELRASLVTDPLQRASFLVRSARVLEDRLRPTVLSRPPLSVYDHFAFAYALTALLAHPAHEAGDAPSRLARELAELLGGPMPVLPLRDALGALVERTCDLSTALRARPGDSLRALLAFDIATRLYYLGDVTGLYVVLSASECRTSNPQPGSTKPPGTRTA